MAYNYKNNVAKMAYMLFEAMPKWQNVNKRQGFLENYQNGDWLRATVCRCRQNEMLRILAKCWRTDIFWQRVEKGLRI